MQYGMMDYGYGMMSGGWWILGLIFWILIIIGIVLLIKHLCAGRCWVNVGHESALETLKTRYAKGEISKEEFEEKKKDIV